ncbi:MAG: hypothetical protein U0R19_37450 [Bryobacteraceae bacterium]
MLAGHLGAAVAARRFAPQTNVGWLVLAALFADVLLWTLILLGAERVVLPVDPESRRYLTFVFPYSHSLVATVIYACLFGALALRQRTWRLACIVAATIASHFVLDALVHIPDLTLAGADSLRFGTSLQAQPLSALALEAVLTLAGLILYWPVRRNAVVAVVAVTLLLTIFGTLWGPLPDSETQAAVGPLVTNLMLIAACLWLDRDESSRPLPK